MKTSLLSLVLFLSLSLFLVSCRKQGRESDGAIPVVSLEPGDGSLSHENVMEIIDWVEIKADSSIFIGNPDKIEVFGSDYYILDTKKQKCVLRYSSDGTLVNGIGRFGDGPEEYPSILDFTVDRYAQRIYILSYDSTIYTYSIDGAFVSKVKLTDDVISRLSCNPKGLMTTSSYSSRKSDTDGFLLSEYNRDFSLTGQWIPYTQTLRPSFAALAADRLVTLGNTTYYFDDINLALFGYDSESDQVDTLLSFDLKNRMPEEFFADNMRFMTEQLNYNWVKDFVLTADKLIIGYIYDGKFSISVIDRDGNVLTAGQYRGPFPQSFPIDDNTLVSPIDVDFYLSYWKDQPGMKQPSFPVNEDTNLLLLRWKISSKFN